MQKAQRILTPALPFCHSTIKVKNRSNRSIRLFLITLGDHLRAKRLDLGLTQKQAAEELGVDEATVHNWETNHSIPAVKLVPRIIQFLSYTPYTPANSMQERLGICRRSLGLSQKRLAKMLDVDESSLRNWESGGKCPSKRSRQILETFFNEGMTLTS